jgi:hypothetical protein
MKASAFNVMQVLEIMTGEKGIKAQFPLLESKIELVKTRFSNPPLPPQFATLLPQNYDETVASETRGNARGTPLPQQELCMEAGATYDEVGRHVSLDPFYPTEPNIVVDDRETRVLTHIPYEIKRFVVFGGRPFYDIQPLAANKWTSAKWTRTIPHQVSGKGIGLGGVAAQDDIAIKKGCFEIENSQKGSPRLFTTFAQYLGSYAGLVSLQGRLLALQEIAQKDLATAKKAHDQLSK